MPKCGRRTEPTELDHQWRNVEVTSNAPFGTTETPTVRVKIIGGKPVTVLEDTNTDRLNATAETPRLHEQQTSRSDRYEQAPRLAPLTEKPNEFNPNLLRVKRGHMFTSAQPDAYNSHLHTPEPTGTNQFSPHPVLPPISPKEKQDAAADSDPLSKYVTHSGYLPSKPVTLPKADEIELRRRVHRDLQGFDARKLKDIYLELTGFDRNLTGCVNYSDLGITLMRSQMHISADNLRLVASLFINDESTPGMINYEKVLSFLGSSMKSEEPSHEQRKPNIKPANRPPTSDSAQNGIYFSSVSQNETDFSPRHKKFPYDRDNAKLLRLVEQQLTDADEDVDLYKVWQVFRVADRDHRGKMSRDQIKSLAYGCRIPLQESLLNQIIDKCDCSNAQHDWAQFLDFIERVQPVTTGLGIPESKKPTEYVKHFPQPSVNWPRNPEDLPMKQSHQGNTISRSMPHHDHDHRGQPRHSRVNEQSEAHYQDDAALEQQRQKIRYDHQVSKRMTDQGKNINQEVWFGNFMEMASALYDKDKHGVGYLSARQVKSTVDHFNESLHLNLRDDQIGQSISAYTVNDRVMLDPFLKSLGTKGP